MLAGVDLYLLPRVVGRLGQFDVGGSVIGQPDDPAVILGPSTGVTELELFDTEDVAAESAGGPVGGGAADSSQTEDRQPVVGHISPSRYRRMSIE